MNIIMLLYSVLFNFLNTYFDLKTPLLALTGAERWPLASAIVAVLASSSSNCFLGKPVTKYNTVLKDKEHQGNSP